MFPEPYLQLAFGALVNLKLGPRSVTTDDLLDASDRALIRLVTQGVPDRVMAQRLAMSEDEIRESLINVFRKLAVAGLLDQLLFSGAETERIAC